MRTHYILFILLFVISCKNIKDETLTNVLTNMEINIPKKEINNLDFITNAEYVQLDNNHLIGEIGRLFLDKKKIIVFDKIDNAIVFFDHKGKFLKSIKKKGRGAGGYIRITDIALDRKNNSIIIFDEMSHKLVYYDLDSYKFLKETGIGFYPTSFVVSGAKLFFYNPFTLNYSGNKEFYFSLIETNEDLEIVNTYFPVNKKLGMFMASDNGPGLTYGSNIIYFRNRFISILSAENIAQLHSNQSLEQLDKSYRNSKFYKRFKNISVNENPIIAFYEFN
jgi:hypothetical protein